MDVCIIEGGGRLKVKLKPIYHSPIPVLIGRRYNTDTLNAKERRRISSNVIRLDVVQKSVVEKLQNGDKVPALIALNAVALTKPHAVQQLAVDLVNYYSDVAVITETHFKSKHVDAVMNIPGYILFRRDRQRRRGGSVAIYARSTTQSTVWTYSKDDLKYEVLWVRVAGLFIGALYHPPRPQYSTESLLDYIEACVDELSQQASAAPIVLAGVFNQLSDGQLIEKTGLLQIVRQATRGPDVLDRIFVTSPMYSRL